jgi:hypothetical protein
MEGTTERRSRVIDDPFSRLGTARDLCSKGVRASPGTSFERTLAPICLAPFTIEALLEKRLSAEHVPPKSVGGRELLLTCTVCNNSAGTKLDADAKTKEDVRIAMAGMLGRPHRIKATIGSLRVNGELRTSGGSYSLQIPPKINKPGTNEALRNVAREVRN